ncbi:MAG: response regulator transcription factor [Bacteroidetes bacterium]|uniref:Response regulator transcription factor n=1 Tax=Phaeocystidibacter marisrubri TaxID=1577780 RepID=A0A6L3ZHA9_9FLAO|nr:response regulator [Phaeocystidibacter marisrubri]KAB2817009.1 response regulator transcription factor [Phaeocystidibacter marisrubri]TNE31454.1 MAG: response regulator transcription factor [Bacteroidota bacterium]GGH77223.1 DNA-binding response regulator [Phaeocystidibacter marisrubri]
MIRCIVIEDQAPAQRVLKKFIADVDYLDLREVFNNAIQAMEYLKSEPVDLMFLDVNLPKINGMDFLASLQNPPRVILTTAFTEYALQGYEYNVVDYLVKPFSFERFVKAVSKVPQELPQKSEAAASQPMFIKVGFDWVKVNSADITHIHSDMDYTEVNVGDKVYLSQDSLTSWEQKLDNLGFTRIHKSYLLNTEQIEKISGNRVYTKSGVELPIGRAYKDDFLSRILS